MNIVSTNYEKFVNTPPNGFYLDLWCYISVLIIIIIIIIIHNVTFHRPRPNAYETRPWLSTDPVLMRTAWRCGVSVVPSSPTRTLSRSVFPQFLLSRWVGKELTLSLGYGCRWWTLTVRHVAPVGEFNNMFRCFTQTCLFFTYTSFFITHCLFHYAESSF